MNRMTRWTVVVALATASFSFAQSEADESTESGGTPIVTGQDSPDRVRFRGGFSVGGGLTLAGFGTMPTAMAQGRFGAQFNRLFSVFFQPSGVVALNVTPVGASAIVASMNSFIANLTLGDVFEVGAGPSIDYLVAGAATAAGPTAAVAGIVFGVDARVGFIVGGGPPNENGRRSGFSIVLNVHPTFAPGTTIVPLTIGLGSDWY
jgi:hypothetical protein